MIVHDFKENYLMFENMAIWESATLEDFFKSHELLLEIFVNEYKFTYEQRNDQEAPFTDSDLVIISKLLDYFGDKYFFVFTYNDANHNILKEFQDKKIINFGIDVHMVNPSRIYVMEMDKTKDPKMYDTI